MAPHLFDGFTITSMAYGQMPRPRLWCVRSDGQMLGLTYLPQHDVISWDRHDTAFGVFESVCTVTEGTEDILYVVTQRTINGSNVRFVERKHSRLFTQLADGFFVDAGLSYLGPAVQTLTGLYHLEGMLVSILGDGVVNPPQLVVNGSVALQHSAANIHVGLQIVADLESLPLSSDREEAVGLGTLKNVSNVYMRLDKSSGVMAGPDFDKLLLLRQRTTEPYGSPPNLMSGEVRIGIIGVWDADGTVCIRQADPLPLTVVGLVNDLAKGG